MVRLWYGSALVVRRIPPAMMIAEHVVMVCLGRLQALRLEKTRQAAEVSANASRMPKLSFGKGGSERWPSENGGQSAWPGNGAVQSQV